MPLAYIYSRVSSQRQVDGLGLRRQAEVRDRWLAQHADLNLTVVEDYSDLGVSARGQAQTEGKLSLILEDIRTGKIGEGSYLIVDSLDRLTREQLVDAVGRIVEIIRAGIVIVTTEDGMIYDRSNRDQAMSQLMFTLCILARSSNESDVKSDRGRKNWAIKRGIAATGSPITRMTPAWIDFDDAQGKLILNEHARTVHRIFELASQGLGTGLIVQSLIKEGRPAMTAKRRKDGGKWSRRYVGLILENRAVLGEFQPGIKNHETGDQRRIVGDAIPDYYPKVSENIASLWERVQAVRADRKDVDTRNRRGDFTNIFAGLCRCATCGDAMTINHRQAPSKISYLRCPSHFMTKTCGAGESYRYDLLEKMVLNQLDSLLLIEISDDGQIMQLESDLAAARHSVERLTKAINNLLNDAEEQGMSEVRERLNIRRDERKQGQQRIADLQTQLIIRRQTIPTQERVAAIAAKRLEAATDDLDARTAARAQLKKHLARLISKIEFKPNKLVTVYFQEGSDRHYELDLVVKPEAASSSTIIERPNLATLSTIRWRNPPGGQGTAKRLESIVITG